MNDFIIGGMFFYILFCLFILYVTIIITLSSLVILLIGLCLRLYLNTKKDGISILVYHKLRMFIVTVLAIFFSISYYYCFVFQTNIPSDDIPSDDYNYPGDAMLYNYVCTSIILIQILLIIASFILFNKYLKSKVIKDQNDYKTVN
jgi:hypothetical protein